MRAVESLEVERKAREKRADARWTVIGLLGCVGAFVFYGPLAGLAYLSVALGALFVGHFGNKD